MTTYLRAVALATALSIALPCLAQQPDTFQAQLKLCEAITSGDAKAAAAALDGGANVSQVCPKEMLPPLHQAIVSGKVEVAALLLDRGADVNQPDNGVSATPLHYAAAKEDPALVALLLKRGAKVDAVTDEGLSPLGMAVLSHDNAAVAQALIDAGADVNSVDEQGDTLTDLALAAGHKKVAAVLEAKGGKRGEEPGMAAEEVDAPAETHQAAPAQATGNRTPDGLLLFKGLYIGMPVAQAVQRMKELGLPPETIKSGSTVPSEVKAEKGYVGRLLIDSLWDIHYDEASGRVKKFRFLGPTVATMFNAADMDAKQFARAFMDAYAIPAMEPVATHNWGFEYIDPAGWKVRIEEDRALNVEAVAAATQRAFD